VVEQTRAMLMTTEAFPWASWSMYSIVGLISAFLGLKAFRALRPGFADVI